MKWVKRPKPRHGDIRVCVSFHLFPKTINRETHWLTWSEWQEQYIVSSCAMVDEDGTFQMDTSRWRLMAWIHPIHPEYQDK